MLILNVPKEELKKILSIFNREIGRFVLLDVSCFFIYTQRHKLSWNRFKNQKRIANL